VCINSDRESRVMQTDLKTVDEQFKIAMEKVLEKVTMIKKNTMETSDPDYSIVLDNFGAFSGFFSTCLNTTKNAVDNSLVSASIIPMLNERFKGENFNFNDRRSETDKVNGQFDLYFDGNAHNIRLRAWVDYEQGGQHRKNRVGVYIHIHQQHNPTVHEGWCKCC